MNDNWICPVCGSSHPRNATDFATCPVVRDAAAAGARPKGVPLSVYEGYNEARAALRAENPAAATRLLQDLLSTIAAQRGVSPELSFSAKLHRLGDEGVISQHLRAALLEHALAATSAAEQAWALMSIAEHVFYRLYLKPDR